MVLTRKDNGRFDLPGGHVHVGEEHIMGAIREVYEETKLILLDIKELIKFHKTKGRQATLTAVKPPGRFGAIKYFIESQNEINSFFVCNCDTIFLYLKRNQLVTALEDFNGKPIIYLAPKDNSRSDYKEVQI